VVNARRKANPLKRSVLAVSLLFPLTLTAKPLGTIGELFPIAEKNLLEVIQENIAGSSLFETTLSSDHFQALWDRPSPVGLPRTTKAHTWLFDPTVDGFNPLDQASLNEPLLFYNAGDPSQVKWAKQTDKHLKGHATLILVGGSINKQWSFFHKPIYFDQDGMLSKRFQLQHSPVLITQQDRTLKIEEVLLP
jgi:conjugal transfer pilus assembly protein TraW